MFKQVIIAAAALVAAGAAQAAPPQAADIASVTVSVAGIDTRSDSGALIMLQRIKAAAGEVCGGTPSQVLDRKQTFDPCVHDVTQRTVASLNNPRVAGLFNKDAAPAAKLASAR